MIDYTSGAEQDQPTLRKMGVKVLVDRWDWITGKKRDTIDITDSVLSFTFGKTTRTAMGGGTVSLVPLIYVDKELKHVMDVFEVLDVVRVFEFDTLKFQGYIRRPGTKMSVGTDGIPTRTVTLTITHIGGLLQEAHLGFQLIALRIKDLDTKLKGFNSRIIALVNAIASKMEDGGVLISDIISTVIDEWFVLLDAIGATNYKTFLETYIDFKSGLTPFTAERVLPSSLAFFYDSSGEMSLWNEILKLCEMPFNEIFFDEGQRNFFYLGSAGASTGGINQQGTSVSAGLGGNLPAQKTYLIGRQTPFDGTYRYGTEQDYFKQLPVKTIPLNWINQIDLAKSSEESYSLYLAVPMYSGFNELSLLCAGQAEIDDAMISKYLLRPLTMKLFYATMAKKDATAPAATQKSFDDEMKGAVKSLKNWFQHNDKFLSGVIDIHVPKDPLKDIYIGDKIKLNGIDAYWYVEGLTHSWQYGGALRSSLTVTRGWDYDKDQPIKLTHAIFTGAGFPSKTNKRGGF
jgi:hypothetical protein